MNLKSLLQISRPRFWLYLAGPYLVGYTFGTQTINGFHDPYFIIHFFYFLIPANILLYGINDFFDYDTDQFNNKKGSIEHNLIPKEKNNLVGILLICLALSFFLLAIQIKNEVQLLISFFLFLNYFYSAPPLRFKSRPIIDFCSNILYGLPALVGYYQSTNNFPSLFIMIAIFCWTSAMHLFSAIPDISPDKKANLNTSAVMFGKTNSLVICLIFWLITSGVMIYSYPHYISLISLIYPIIPLILLLNNRTNINKIYWYFPYINAFCGFLLFLIAIQK